MGFMMVSWGIGSATGPYFGGLIFDHMGGYQLAFSAGGVLMVIAAICILELKSTTIIRGRRSEHGAKRKGHRAER